MQNYILYNNNQYYPQQNIPNNQPNQHINDQGKEINKNMEISKVREDKDINTEDPQKIKNIKKSDLFLVDSRFKNIRKILNKSELNPQENGNRK